MNTTSYSKYIISLLDINNEEKMKFNLNLLELSFLGKDLHTVPIYHYPMLILEFLEGNYTTTELFAKNDILVNGKQSFDDYIVIDDNNLNIGEIENMTEITSINDDDYEVQPKKKAARNASVANINLDLLKEISKNMGNKNNVADKKKSIFINRAPDLDLTKTPSDKDKNKISEKENKKDKKNKKKKNKKKPETKEKKIDSYNFSDYFDLYTDKILIFRDKENQEMSNIKKEVNITAKIKNYKNIIESYKRKYRLNEIEREIEFYKNKDKDINDIKQKIKEIINNKKRILSELNESIKGYKIKYTELKTNNHNNLTPLIAKQQLLYDSFLNKKIVEICFVFFNKKIKNLYLIPEIFLHPIKSDNSDLCKKRIEFYNNNKKKISSMMGHITQMMIYMSKCFDIPLRYPLWLNGAKSFIFKGKNKEKDFLPLHCDLKRDDKYINFEAGLNYLKNDFKEILNFCSMYPEIIPENENLKFEKENEDSFFTYFIIFNTCLSNFIKNIQKMFE